MARDIRLTPYDEQMIEPFDEDASGPEYTAYGSSTPSTATQSYFPPEDSMPLFLSDDPEAPRQRGFGTGGERNRSRSPVWPRILKAGIFTASAAAIAFAIVSVENPLALFANAKASLIGTSLGQTGVLAKSASEPPVPVRLASTEPSTPAAQTTVGVRASTPAAMAAPTRDEIAAALRSAHQSPPEIRQPPAAAPAALAAPAAPAAPPARHLAPDELATLLKRAKGLIEIGDIAPARLLLERAADAQEASAALMLAQTYDPAVLGKQDMRSITPDPAMARDWYQKAARLGSLDAKQRLAQMQN
jgi:TPR repeat protein